MNLAAKADCCGCAACANICPHGCIAMVPDGEGFSYPQIDSAKCVSCGLCQRACPVLRPVRGTQDPPAAWAVRARDTDLRLKSSSGGAFSLLAEDVLAGGGAVFGAAMTPDCMGTRHVMAEDAEGLAALRTSKYLQSEIGGCFRQVREELESGRAVLFSGTPCQIDGLKGFLGRDYEDLLCVEVICHGVPSPALWRKYAAYMGKKSGAPLTNVNFRHKKYGWITIGIRLENSKRRVLYSTLENNPYFRMFLLNLCLRPSCYRCPSKGLDRPADLTLGDFWGVEKVCPELHDDKGTSLALAHTPKGAEALANILNRAEAKQVDRGAALERNAAMLRPVARPPERDSFFSDMDALSFPELRKKYLKENPFKTALIHFLRRAGLLEAALWLRRKLKRRPPGRVADRNRPKQ